MKRELETLRFIREHEDWEDILSKEPYCLDIKRDNVNGKKLILFKYNQIESDFSLEIVKECRGIVFDEDTWEVVVFPFTKFFNANEEHADKIDWSTAKVTEKLDGSIIKIVKMKDGRLLIGTNSNIDAFKAPLADQVGCSAKTFGDLIVEGMGYYGLTVEKMSEILETGKTYIFELTSPFNQIVVRWSETKISLIGIRDNITYQEERFEDSPLSKVFNIPRIYDLSSEEECVKAASELPDSEEGYVVRDAEFRRIKIKSPRYVELHRIAGNGILSTERAIDIVKANEMSEIISYFPNFKTALEEVSAKYDKLISDLDASWDGFMTIVTTTAPRKEAATWITKNISIPGFGFAMLDGKVRNAREFVERMPSRNISRMLGYRD